MEEKEPSSLPPSSLPSTRSAPAISASVMPVLGVSTSHGRSPPPLLVTSISSPPGAISPPATAPIPVTAIKTVGDHVTPVVMRGEGKPKSFMEMSGEESKRPLSDGGGGKKAASSKVASVKTQAPKGGGKGGGEGGSVPTRSSQRQIKRPKTDDELIDFEASSRSKKHRPAGAAASKSSVVR